LKEEQTEGVGEQGTERSLKREEVTGENFIKTSFTICAVSKILLE
jgi:hypothetical protein